MTCPGSAMSRTVAERGCLIRQEAIGPDFLVMTIEAPAVARHALPGQFVHVSVGSAMLRRPFSVFRAERASGRIELLYRVKGVGTRRMAGWVPGAEVDMLGPLGHGFAARREGERILLVGGGIGVAPLAFFGEAWPGQGVALLGFRSAAEVCAHDRLEASGFEVIVTTIDGSFGRRGLVVEPLRGGAEEGSGAGHEEGSLGRIDRVLTCGPWLMMAEVARWAAERGLPCEAALEREMGCGIGACLGCVVETTDPARPFARVCTEGPVMDARGVRWP